MSPASGGDQSTYDGDEKEHPQLFHAAGVRAAPTNALGHRGVCRRPRIAARHPPPLSPDREDGYTYGYGNAFQGVRAYDSTMAQWTAPDAYAGDVHDPMSQKPFMWNNNNPLDYEDPSGYDPIVSGKDAALNKRVTDMLTTAKNANLSPYATTARAFQDYLKTTDKNMTINVVSDSKGVTRDAKGNVTGAQIAGFDANHPDTVTIYMGSVDALPADQRDKALEQGIVNDVGTAAALNGRLGTPYDQSYTKALRSEDSKMGSTNGRDPDAALDRFANFDLLKSFGLCCDK